MTDLRLGAQTVRRRDNKAPVKHANRTVRSPWPNAWTLEAVGRLKLMPVRRSPKQIRP